MRCLRGPLYSMEAELLHFDTRPPVEEDDNSSTGFWESYQDPLTFEILNRWVKGQPDDPDTLADETETTDPHNVTFPCMARGVIDGGIRVAGTTERFGSFYENVDYIKMKVPPFVKITKRDRVTNIRQKKGGQVLWRDEERDGRPTVFNVNGVTPVLDGFNNLIEWHVLLERTNSEDRMDD